MQSKAGAMYLSLRSIYKPKYILLNAALAVVLYFVFNGILSYQQQGVPLYDYPIYLEYALVASSSIVMTIAVFSAANTRNNSAKVSASAAGTVTALAGAVFSGCGCSASLLFSLSAFALSSAQIFALDNFIVANQAPLLLIMIVINLFVAIYYLNKLSRPSCRVKVRRR